MTGSTQHLGFHGRVRRHHEDADTYADAITELCHVDIRRATELRQELISEQFDRGQSDPELKKYLWVVIRTQKERKLQTLIEVCTDFASLGQLTTVHRPAEQMFALEEDEDPEDMVAMMEHSQWTSRGTTEPNMPPPLSTDVCACSPNGLRDVSDRTPYRDHSSTAKFPKDDGTGLPGTVQART